MSKSWGFELITWSMAHSMSPANWPARYVQLVAGLCDGRPQPLLWGGGLGPGPGVGPGAGGWVVGGGGGKVVVGGRMTGMRMGVSDVGRSEERRVGKECRARGAR